MIDTKTGTVVARIADGMRDAGSPIAELNRRATIDMVMQGPSIRAAGIPSIRQGHTEAVPWAASCAIHMNPNDPVTGIERNVVVRTVKAPCLALIAMT